MEKDALYVERVTLRGVEVSDAPMFLSHRNEKELMVYTRETHPKTKYRNNPNPLQ